MANIKLHNPVLAENCQFGNLVLEGRATDPVVVGLHNAGRIWFNTAEKKLKGTFINAGGTGLDTRVIADSTDISALSQRVTSLESQTDGLIGDLSTLTTTAKNNLVAAINEVDADVLSLTNNKVDKINITGGTVGSATAIPTINYNAQGQITSVSSSTIQIDLQGVTDLGNTADNAIVLHDADTNTAGVTADFLTTANAVTAGSLSVSGTSTLNSATLSGGLTVTGATDLNGAVTIGNTTWDSGVLVDLGGNRITNVGTPTANTDAVTKGYIDGLMSAGFTLSDGTNTTAVSQGDTLVVNGTTNEIEVLVGTDAITIGLPDNVQIAGTLGVTGVSTLGTVNAGATSVTTLSTSGLATLDSASVTKTLTVAGVSTLGTVNAGATSVTTLATSGLATLDSASVTNGLTVLGTTTTNGISNTGDVSTSTLTTTGNASVGGTLTVTGNTTVSTLTATGTSTLADVDATTLDTTGDVTVGGALEVTGTSTLTDVEAVDITVETLTVTGTSALQGATTVGTALTNANLTVNGDIIGNGDGTFEGDVVVKGNLTISGAQTIVETEILKVADNIITLNNGIGEETEPTEHAGLEVDRGIEGVTTFLRWNETIDSVEIYDAGSMVRVATIDDVGGQQEELDLTQASAGINADGSFTSFTGTYTTDTNLRSGIVTLDTNLNRVETGVGAWGTLTTTSKVVVGAINELDAELGNTPLTTGASTITAAINEVDTHANSLYTVLGVTSDATVTGFADLNYVADDATVKAAITTLDSTLKTRVDNVNTAAGITGDAYTADATTNYLALATSLMDADKKLDAQLKATTDQVDGNIGDLTSLTTTVKSTLVGAINEVDAHANNLYSTLGTTQDATTVDFTGANYVAGNTTFKAAVITLDSTLKTRVDNVNTAAGITGDTYTADATTNYLKLATSLMDADKKLDAQLKATTDQVDGNIGVLTDLTTDVKTTLVGAINEIDSHANGIYTVLGVTTDATVTGFTDLNYVADDATVKAAVTTLDSTLKTRADAINTASGITGDAYTADSTTNYLKLATSLMDADKKLDAQLKATTDQVDGNIGDLTALTTDVKTTLVGAINEIDSHANNLYAVLGETLDGTTANFTGTNYVSSSTTVHAAIVSLDNKLKTRADAINTAVGITGDTYSANGAANYISEATSLNDADVLLDTALKTTVDDLAATTSGNGSALVGFKGYTETDANIYNPTIEIAAGTLEAAINDIASSVNLKLHEIDNRYVKGEVALVDASDTYTIAHNLDTNFVDVSVQVYDADALVWRFDLVVVEVIDVNTVKISLASGISAQIRYVIHGY